MNNINNRSAPLHSIDHVDESTLINVAAQTSRGIAGKGILLFLNYLSVILIIRKLGPNGYGLIVLAYSIIILVAILASFGFNESIVRFVSLYTSLANPHRAKGAFWGALKIISFNSIILTIVILIGAPVIATRWFSKPELEPVLILFALSIFPLAVGRAIIAGLQAVQQIKLKVMVEYILRPAIFIISIFLFAYILKWGPNGIATAYSISFGAACLISVMLLKSHVPSLTERRISPEYRYREIIVYSLPLLGTGFLDFSVERIDTLMLGFLRSADQVGIYATAARVATFMLLFADSIGIIFAPLVSSYQGQGRQKEVFALLKSTTKWLITLSLAMFVLFALFGKEIMSLFGPLFELGWVNLLVISLGWLCYNFSGPTTELILMTGHPSINLFNYLILAGSDIILNLCWIPRYGAIGAAWATAASLAIFSLLKLAEIRYLFGSHPYRQDIYKPFVAAFTAGGIAYASKIAMQAIMILPIFKFIIGAALFIPVYILVLKILKFSSDDLVIIRLLKNKLGLAGAIPKHDI